MRAIQRTKYGKPEDAHGGRGKSVIHFYAARWGDRAGPFPLNCAKMDGALPQSWVHFLEDVADKMEGGHAVVESPGVAGENWSYLNGAVNKAFFNAFPAWSKAKLPRSFQGDKPA
jgi:hypothetical protein